MNRYRILTNFSVNLVDFKKGDIITLPHKILHQCDIEEFLSRGWIEEEICDE